MEAKSPKAPVPEIKSLSNEEVAACEVFDDANATKGYVYIIAEFTKENGPPTWLFKVGRTVDPAKRLGDLRTGNPRPIHYHDYFEVSDAAAAEKAAQTAVDVYKSELGGGTEWYDVPKNNWDRFLTSVKNAVKPYKIK